MVDNNKFESLFGEIISQQVADRLIAEFKGKKTALKIKEFMNVGNCYKLKDGRLLTVSGGKYVLYSLEETDGIIDGVDSGLFVAIPADFSAMVPIYIDTLATLLNKDPTFLENRTLEELDKIDSLIYKLDKSGDLFESKFLFPLVAYTGEVIRKRTNGSWIIQRKSEEELIYIKESKKMFGDLVKQNEGEYNLFVKGENGELYNPHELIQSILIRGAKRYSIQVAVKGIIG